MYRLLRQFYDRVYTPAEAPEKLDYGDIDILVDRPLHNFTRETLAHALGAVDHLKQRSVSSFAIPISESGGEYLQLDVHACHPDIFEWETTLYAYGDLWRILGCCANRHGLAINDSGLHLRIPEIDKTHPKDSLLHLTSDPRDIMDFLGLDFDAFITGFATLDEAFTWATSSRFFIRRPFEKVSPSKKDDRPMYRQFVTEWLPAHPELSADLAKGTLTPEFFVEEVHIEAVQRYQKHEAYISKVEHHKKRLMKDAMWSKIAKSLACTGKELGQAMVALKAGMRWKDEKPYLCESVENLGERVPALEEKVVDEAIVPWVLEHWREAVEINAAERNDSG